MQKLLNLGVLNLYGCEVDEKKVHDSKFVQGEKIGYFGM